METTSTASAGVQPQTALYEQTLRKIIRDDLTGTADKPGLWITALERGNVWRSSWAFETLIDSIATLRSLDPDYQPPAWNGQSFIDYGLEHALNPSSGNWWDDFGWLGITCLRIVELGLATADQERILLHKAANSWCYMYGNGWKEGSHPNDWGKFTVPYDDAWDKYGICKNQGAPNAFLFLLDHTEENDPGRNYAPRFGGGVWNNKLNHEPAQSPYYNPTGTSLNPVQNTVTNGLYLLLTVRLCYAFTNSKYQPYFSESPVVLKTVQKAWETQLFWFRDWLKLDDKDRCLLRSSGTGAGLVRERVSTFANGNWDNGYYKGLAWTGDQGLVIAALRESLKLVKDLNTPGIDRIWLEKTYLSILNGSRASFYSDQGQTDLGVQMRPWINFDDASGNQTFPEFPLADDDPDYQTGIATFYRYLMQLHSEQPEPAEQFRDIVYQTANAICEGFPPPNPDEKHMCEGMMKQIKDASDRQDYNFLTPWINRAALLCVAIRFAKQ